MYDMFDPETMQRFNAMHFPCYFHRLNVQRIVTVNSPLGWTFLMSYRSPADEQKDLSGRDSLVPNLPRNILVGLH